MLRSVAVTLVVLAVVVGYAKAKCLCNPSNQACAVPGVVSSYYACQGSETLTFQCDSGSGFISNNQTSGCVSYDSPSWSCLNIKNGINKPPNCRNVNRVPQAATANSFWACDEKNTANLVNCPTVRPYFYASNEYLGCVTYIEWQKLTGYPNC